MNTCSLSASDRLGNSRLDSNNPLKAAPTPAAILRRSPGTPPLFLLLLLLLSTLMTACTNSMLASARTDIAAGHYGQAHDQLEAALQNPALSARDRLEAKDDLCEIETNAGAPSYSLMRQRQTCADAAREPGSSSGERLAKINAEIGAQYKSEFERSLAAGNLGNAVAAVRGYERVEPGDTQTIAHMNHRLWAAVDHQDQKIARHKKGHVHLALEALDDDYPGLQRMNQRAFKRWVGKGISPSGAPMVSAIAITGHTLELKVPDNNLKQSALAPQKFAQINDAFSVWCQCDGATHVASDSTGLPVYLARFNPSMARSEVLVLPWR